MFAALALLLIQTPTPISPVLLAPPPSADHLHRPIQRVTVRLSRPPSEADWRRLIAAGARPVELVTGGRAQVGRVVSVDVARSKLRELAKVEGVQRIEPARPLVTIKPLDQTAGKIGAHQVWSPPRALLGTDGTGIRIADHEGGWDPFHPDFFKPDGEVIDFEDANNDGIASAGDRVDLDGDGTPEATLSLLEGIRDDLYTGEEGFADPGFQPSIDWLYVDLNRNNRRDFGEAYSDDTPALGEPIYAGDDVNQNERLEVGERLIRLKTPKVVAIDNQGFYERGRNLAQYPRMATDPSHGTGATGIVAGGWPGLRRYTGIAPGAELIFINGGEDGVSGLANAINLGALVNFFEWNSPVDIGDGSSNFEVAVSESARNGAVPVAAAGNLANADHCMSLTSIGTATRTVTLTTDRQGVFFYNVFWLSISWRGGENDLHLNFQAQNDAADVPEGTSSFGVGGFRIDSFRETTDRGTGRILLVVSALNGRAIPETEITLALRATRQLGEVRGLLFDDQSGWGRGVRWTTDITDRGTALMPSTSDRVIGVAAYGGNHDLSQWGWGAQDERRSYSGVGPRLDGARVVDIAAPDDPFAPRSDSASTHGAYSAFGGTSGALPHTAGAAALLLAARPSMSFDEVETALYGGAVVDRFTGAVPNDLYGHGKLDVARALHNRVRTPGSPPPLALQTSGAAVINQPLTISAMTSPGVTIEWDVGYDRIPDDEPLGTRLDLVPSELGYLPIVARAIDEQGRWTRALLRLEVLAVAPPDAGVFDTGVESDGGVIVVDASTGADASGNTDGTNDAPRPIPESREVGCGCNAASRSVGSAWFAALFAGALWMMRRGRR